MQAPVAVTPAVQQRALTKGQNEDKGRALLAFLTVRLLDVVLVVGCIGIPAVLCSSQQPLIICFDAQEQHVLLAEESA